ncbi:MAG: DUF1697 domain-containing protein [Thiobacillaceae bacterium]
MPRFVALLKGVNVGRAKRVPMADFRALLTALGYDQVQTLLNSGNAVFKSAGRSTTAHATRIHAALLDKLGVDAAVTVKSANEMAAIESGNALADIAANPSHLLVAFTSDAQSLAALTTLSALVHPPEHLHLGAHALYLWCADGILESKAAEALLGKPGKAATTRNMATVMKITALLHASPDC